jgi:hypothetical protein
MERIVKTIEIIIEVDDEAPYTLSNLTREEIEIMKQFIHERVDREVLFSAVGKATVCWKVKKITIRR